MIATPQDLRAVRSVAINVADEAITPFIEDAEKQDVLPAIGAELYFAIEADPAADQYKDLLGGTTFTGRDGKTLYTRGLIAAIAYLAYARMLILGDIQYTAYGAVLKNAQYSQKPSEVDKIRAADAAKKTGFAILQTVADYLRDTRAPGECKRLQRVERPKFVAIKKHGL